MRNNERIVYLFEIGFFAVETAYILSRKKSIFLRGNNDMVGK
jgi:hypothetical protein